MNHWVILGAGLSGGTIFGLLLASILKAGGHADDCAECRREGELAAQLVEMNAGEHEPEPEDAILADTGAIVALMEEAHTLAADACCEEEAAATLEGPRRAFLRLPMAGRRRVMAEQVTDEAVAYYAEGEDE
jgi:hypothetical protein